MELEHAELVDLAKVMMVKQYDSADDAKYSLRTDTGYSVAHEMAKRGFVFPEQSNLLFVADNTLWTVAHEMAAQGHVFNEAAMAMGLTDENEVTVAEVVQQTQATNSSVGK